MKKIILLLIFFTTGAFATEMCARNDTVVVVLDAATGAKSHRHYEALDFTYSVFFEYGIVHGVTACLTEKEVKSLHPTGATTGLLDSRENNLWGLYGEDTDPEPRVYCTCKITHPVSSKWYVLNKQGGAKSCREMCPTLCVTQLRDNYLWRENMYQSIGI